MTVDRTISDLRLGSNRISSSTPTRLRNKRTIPGHDECPMAELSITITNPVRSSTNSDANLPNTPSLSIKANVLLKAQHDSNEY